MPLKFCCFKMFCFAFRELRIGFSTSCNFSVIPYFFVVKSLEFLNFSLQKVDYCFILSKKRNNHAALCLKRFDPLEE